MKVAIGCDHGGINLKPVLIDYLNKKGIEFEDFGTYDTKSTDYNEMNNNQIPPLFFYI